MISAPSIRHRQRRASGGERVWHNNHLAALSQRSLVWRARVCTDPSARKHGHLPSGATGGISPKCSSDRGFCSIRLNVMLATLQSLGWNQSDVLWRPKSESFFMKRKGANCRVVCVPPSSAKCFKHLCLAPVNNYKRPTGSVSAWNYLRRQGYAKHPWKGVVEK